MSDKPEEFKNKLKNIDNEKVEDNKQRSLMDDPKFRLPIGLAIGAMGLNVCAVGFRELKLITAPVAWIYIISGFFFLGLATILIWKPDIFKKILKIKDKTENPMGENGSIIQKWTIGVYVTLFSVIVAILIFLSQMHQQRITQLEELINNMKSLDVEFKDNLFVMNVYENSDVTNKNFFGTLVIENLKRSATDGIITNQDVKKSIISVLFDFEQLNNRILFVNSPELNSLILMNSSRYSPSINIYKFQTIDSMRNETQKVIFVDNQVNNYTTCLQTKYDFYEPFWTFRFLFFDYNECNNIAC